MNKEVVTFSIRVPIETKVKLKLLSAAKNTTISKLLERLINDDWEKEGDILSSPKFAHIAGKEIKRIFGGLK